MEIISYKPIKEFIRKHADARASLNAWYAVARKANWGSPADVQQTFRTADKCGKCIIFDIGGTKYRLIIRIDYKRSTIYIKGIFKHSEYDREKWKSHCS